MFAQFVGVCQAGADDRKIWKHISFVRTEPGWGSFQPNGPDEWNQQRLEASGQSILQNAKHGVEVPVCLDYMRPWAASKKAWTFTVENRRYDVAAFHDTEDQSKITITDLNTSGLRASVLSLLAAVFVLQASVFAPFLMAGPLPRANREEDLSDYQHARQVVIYPRPSSAPCFADYVPSQTEADAPFVVRMAGNEHEPMQAGLYVPRTAAALRDVRLEVQCDVPVRIGHVYHMPEDELDWMTDTSAALLKSNFPNINWPVDPMLLMNKRSSIPLYVLPLDRIDAIDPGHSAAFWLTFRTDATVEPGPHRGELRLSAGGRPLRTVPFVVDVHPFVLPRPKIVYAFYYVPYQTPPAFQGRAYQKQYLADMAAHGTNTMQITVEYVPLSEPCYDTTTSTPHVDAWTSTRGRLFTGNYLLADAYEADGGFNVLKHVAAQVALGREAGLVQMDRPLITHPSHWYTDGKHHVMTALQRHGAERGWPGVHLYMRDEPGSDVFDEVIEHVSEWRRLGASTVAAMNGRAAFAVGHMHHVWTVLAGHITPQLLAEARRQGAEVWTYSYSLRTTNAEAARYFAGLYTWSLGLSGNMPYAYMGEPGPEPKKQAQPFFDESWKLSAPSILGYVIPSPAGPVPGVGLEGRREGVDDVRYLQLLEARVDAAPAGSTAAADAKVWLERLRAVGRRWEFHPDAYNAWGADWLDPHPGIAAGDYDTIRADAAAHIMRLPAAPDELNPEPAKARPMPVPVLESAAYEGHTVERCITALKTGTVRHRRQAAASLALRSADEVAPALGALIELLDDPQVRIVAARALAILGPRVAPAKTKLQAMAKDDDAFIRIAAESVLQDIEPK